MKNIYSKTLEPHKLKVTLEQATLGSFKIYLLITHKWNVRLSDYSPADIINFFLDRTEAIERAVNYANNFIQLNEKSEIGDE